MRLSLRSCAPLCVPLLHVRALLSRAPCGSLMLLAPPRCAVLRGVLVSPACHLMTAGLLAADYQ